MSAANLIVRTSDPASDAAGLFARQRGRVFAFCLSRLRNRSDAEDAAQTTFLNAVRLLREGVVPRSETAWMLTLADNACRGAYRSRSRRAEVASDPHVLEDTAPARELCDDLSTLREALQGIPVNQQRAILLREWQGLSYREIALEMGLTQSAVEMLTFRARRSLAASLSRIRRLLDFGGLLTALRALFSSAAAKTLAGVGLAVVVASSAGGASPGAVSTHGIDALKARPGASRPVAPGVSSTRLANQVGRRSVGVDTRRHLRGPARGRYRTPTARVNATSTLPRISTSVPAPAAAPPGPSNPVGGATASPPAATVPTVTLPTVSVPTVTLPVTSTPVSLPPVSVPALPLPELPETPSVTLPQLP